MNIVQKQKSYRELKLTDIDGKCRNISEQKMNQKADCKLTEVAKLFETTLPGHCVANISPFLSKILQMNKCGPVEKIHLLYDVENRFAAISYNLLIQTNYHCKETEEYQFEVQYKGILQVHSAKFVSYSKTAVMDERGQKILNTLNEPIILNKICKLNLMQVLVVYSERNQCWKVSLKSLSGSSTWILIPPVMNLIQPERQEIFEWVELLQMLVSAVSTV